MKVEYDTYAVASSRVVDDHAAKRSARWTQIAEWILIACLAAYMGIHTLPRAWRVLGTDFPNYYLTARLARGGSDTSRIYEWVWLQRQKDHREIDQRVVGLVPITPFSTLVIWPLTTMPPLAAKHCWLIVNLMLLLGSGALIRSLTHLEWQRIALVAGLSFPLHRNLLYGQYYILLLFILASACWLYIHEKRLLAGVLIGLGFALKIFPAVYLLYFLRKRDLKACAGGIISGASAAVLSIIAFGWEVHRTYLFQVVPSALRGEGLDPYNLASASLSSLLHSLFIYEPQWNQHPAVAAPWLFAVLHPMLQMAILAPALLLVAPDVTCPRRIRLEWAAMLLASLAISTSPASYLFTLMILPVCFVWEAIQRSGGLLTSKILLALYLVVGYPGWPSMTGERWQALLAMPRLYAVVLICLLTYIILFRGFAHGVPRQDRRIWAVALGGVLILAIVGGLRHQRGLYTDYQWRLPAPREMLMAVHPASQDDAISFIALSDGYHLATERSGYVEFSKSDHDDYLSVATVGDERWVEKAGRESTIVSSRYGREDIHQAESPVGASSGRWLAFLREDKGRARIWLHSLDQSATTDKPLTPTAFNVFEMSFLPNDSLVFAASVGGDAPRLFTVDQAGDVRSLETSEARYPAVSPDGNWLAYSKLQDGHWNLWLRSLTSVGESRSLTHAECNDVEPTWSRDSRTLIYASDCGRALWFTALCKRRIFP